MTIALRVLDALFLAAIASLCGAPAVQAGEPFAIRVVDDRTGRGVPLVELRTTHDVLYVTDSNGYVAFDEPGLMATEVFFHIRSHGYLYRRDGFGYRGARLVTTPAASVTLKIRRLNVAERLYRVTGSGIYRDSVLLGRPTPLARPLLNARVMGQDSVQSAVFRGRIHWFWGDTKRPRYPLGTFQAPGATSALPMRGGLDPALGVDLEYFEDAQGFARPLAALRGRGPTWLSGLAVLDSSVGLATERMFAHYAKIENTPKGGFRTRERGLVEYVAGARRFVHRKTFTAPLPFPAGAHVLRHTVDAKPYLYFCDPYPLVRVRATVEALSSPESYEAFTPLDTGELDPAAAPARDASGKALWAWKRGTARLTATRHAEWARREELAASEQLLTLRDVDSGQAVLAHRGTVAWNAYRGRYVMIVCESFGSSLVGELWYAEADGPLGPWLYARKIVTHDRYSFYNPRHHPFFDQDGGRLIYFEGTYTRSFSGNPVVTPRYDYNQVMYRLDLDDPRLNLPVAVYREASSGRATFLLGPGASTAGLPIAFWALERPAAGARSVSLGRGAPSIYAPSACAPGVTTLRPLLERRSGPSAEPTYELGASPTAKTTEGRAPIGFAWPHSGRPARLAGH